MACDKGIIPYDQYPLSQSDGISDFSRYGVKPIIFLYCAAERFPDD